MFKPAKTYRNEHSKILDMYVINIEKEKQDYITLRIMWIYRSSGLVGDTEIVTIRKQHLNWWKKVD